jgi:hypothetical protein
MVLLIIFHFCGYFLFGVSDSPSGVSDKRGLQEITDHLMVAGFSWAGSPGHMITCSPDKPGSAQGFCAGAVFERVALAYSVYGGVFSTLSRRNNATWM